VKQKSLNIYSIIYIVVIALFALFWGENFSKFTHIKGDDFFVCAEVLIVINYVFFILLYFIKKNSPIALLLILPIIIAISSFILGFVVGLILHIGNTPREITYLYTTIYGFLTIISLKITSKKTKVPANFT
jgi:hypothetical protein